MCKVKTVLLDFGDTLVREGSTVRDHSGKAVSVEMIPGSLEAVQAVREKGMQIILVANGNSRDIRNLLAFTGTLDKFDAVVISEEEGHEKPEPEIFETALEIAGSVPSEAVMVGNRASQDVAGANGAGGIHSVWFSWEDGYHDEPEGPESSPEFTISSMYDLAAILDRLNQKIK